MTSHLRGIGIALGRLRLGVVTCCWIVGLALALQLLVWSLATFTDMRFEAPEQATESADATAVVTAESPREQRIRRLREAELGLDLGASTEPAAAKEPELVIGRYDRLFATTLSFTGALGRCAMLVLIPLMMVGVMLSAGSATPGIERVVSSLVWALIAAVFILPLGQAFGMPWNHGALTTYDHIVGWVEQVEASPAYATAAATQSVSDGEQAATAGSSLMFYTRLGLLPAMCIVGITLVGLRFCSGVEAGILAAESMRLDPTLEREAANVSPTSLHAGRGSSALGQTLRHSPVKVDDASIPSARAVSPGEAPKRLI